MTDLSNPNLARPILVLGASGKTGGRVATRLAERGYPIRVGSRRAEPAFDWADEAGWPAALEGCGAVYIAFAPDLAVPGAVQKITALIEMARAAGVQRLVLLSGRGESEAQACEQLVLNSGLEATVVRASWFNQNFSEGGFADMVRNGAITLPAGETPEPFVDADDIADVAVAALTEAGHDGEIYEVTGPRLMTLSEVAETLSTAIGRPIRHMAIPHSAFVQGLKDSGAPSDLVWLMDYLFSTVLDGRNAHVCDGVERALGRPARDFADYAQAAAAAGAWADTEAETEAAQ